MRFRCSATALFVLLISVTASGQTLPPLPELALDRFPQSARVSVARAYEEAQVRPKDASAVGALGRLLHAWEQPESAHAAYARAHTLAPKSFEWLYLDAIVLQRLARHSEAAERLKEALKISPDFKPARVKLADALFDAGRIDESRRLYDELAKDPATEPMGDFGLGRIAATQKRHEAAIDHLQRAVSRFPEWGSAHYSLALSYRALGRREDAQQALERHAQYGPQWPTLEDPVLATVTGLRDDARALLLRGIRLAEVGDVSGAITAHEAAIARDPSFAQAHANLISLYGRVRRFEDGERHYHAALKLGGETGDLHYDYGVLLGLQQKWEEAAAAYQKAIATNPSHARARNNLGETLERRRMLEAALETYRGAVEADPGFRLARFNMARMQIALGKPADALTELEKILEPRDAEAPRYLFALSVAYVRDGRKDEGIKWATAARDLALKYGQKELAASISRDLERLK